MDSITCPQCGRTSYHPEDVRQKYCGACHQFHETMAMLRVADEKCRLARGHISQRLRQCVLAAIFCAVAGMFAAQCYLRFGGAMNLLPVPVDVGCFLINANMAFTHYKNRRAFEKLHELATSAFR
jgi:ribosomal protein L37E